MLRLLKFYYSWIWGCFLFNPEAPFSRPGPITVPKQTTTTSKTLGGNPGLLTSTGGLQGINEVLIVPAINITTGNCLILSYLQDNFDCEDDCEYDFRQEANYGQIPGEGRNGTFHLIILKYREIGYASFFVNLTVFNQILDDFITKQIRVNIPVIPLKGKRKQSFPDGRIHTVKLTFDSGPVQGERPQVSITRRGSSGPISITKLILCGNADEMAQQ